MIFNYIVGYFFQKGHIKSAHQKKKSTSTENIGRGAGASSATTAFPTVPCSKGLYMKVIC